MPRPSPGPWPRRRPARSTWCPMSRWSISPAPWTSLAERGFWRIALVGDGEQSLAEAVPAGDVALVLGSEGAGIRRLVREHCEATAFVPIGKAMESLNVSNAAAIALYELRR